MTVEHRLPPRQATEFVTVRGARTHSLQGIDVDIPLQKLTVISGLSGSGKSSLAIDTIGVEGQRRYLAALALGQRQLTTPGVRPPVDLIRHLPPTILMGQLPDRRDRRATLATVADLWPLFQTLYARVGTLHCPACGVAVRSHSRRAISEFVLALPERTKVLILAPLAAGDGESATDLCQRAAREGYVRVRIHGSLHEVTDVAALKPAPTTAVEAVIDRLIVKPGLESRLAESLEAALTVGDGVCLTSHDTPDGWQDRSWYTRLMCATCRLEFPPLQPQLFSWRHPAGACETCHGLGHLPAHASASTSEAFPCPACDGSRLGKWGRAVQLAGRSLFDWLQMSVRDSRIAIREVIKSTEHAAGETFPTADQRLIADRLLTEIARRLEGLDSMGLDYLTLLRSSLSLSNGERQRARLAAALGTRARGVLFVLDEPTAGLHAQDTERLTNHLQALCAAGNTVVAVEHNPDLIAAADWQLELGPGAGPLGGRLLYGGPARPESAITAGKPDLSPTPPAVPPGNQGWLKFSDCRHHNLQSVELAIPRGCLTGVAGVSGSGKTSLLLDCVAPLLQQRLKLRSDVPESAGRLVDDGQIEGLAVISSSLPGRSPFATPATLSGVWVEIRRLLARTRAARRLGWTAARFSYRHPDSRCPRCLGRGSVSLVDLSAATWWMTCPECRGRRYHRGLAAVTYKELSLLDVLGLSVSAAREHFAAIPRIAASLQRLQDLGLGYLPLGQPGTTLSGGELQRLLLGRSLFERATGRTLLILDEPTAGLHTVEVDRLLSTLRQLTAAGHTVVVIEHHLTLLRQVDWLIELGPGSGPEGGRIVAAGSVSEVAQLLTPTGQALAQRP